MDTITQNSNFSNQEILTRLNKYFDEITPQELDQIFEQSKYNPRKTSQAVRNLIAQKDRGVK